MPRSKTVHPDEKVAAYRRGMRDARSIMVEATGEITDEASLQILALAFIRLNNEIARQTGKVEIGTAIDWLRRVQDKARDAYEGGAVHPRTLNASAKEMTPIGMLEVETWQSEGGWRSTYTLNGKPITVRGIKALGLAQRPTTRNRRKKTDECA